MSNYATPLDVLEYPRLALFTPAPGVQNERSSLGWSVLNGNPRCTVWTRVDDKEKGPISGGIGAEALEAIVEQAYKIFSTEGLVDAFAADILTRPKTDTGSTAFEKVVTGTLTVGRDENGICFIGMKAADSSRPQLVFQFRGFEWHPMRRKSTPFTEAELSSIHARAYFKHLEKALLHNPKGQTQEERKAAGERRKAIREGRKPTYQNAAPKERATEFAGLDADFAF